MENAFSCSLASSSVADSWGLFYAGAQPQPPGPLVSSTGGILSLAFPFTAVGEDGEDVR